MDIITLNIYTDTVKNEILEFLEKFKSQEAEIQFKSVTNVTEHPFFGMIKDTKETVEESMCRLRGSRY